MESTDEIVENYDKKTTVRKPSGRHTQKSTKDDVMIIVQQLQAERVYDRIPGLPSLQDRDQLVASLWAQLKLTDTLFNQIICSHPSLMHTC